MVPQEMAWRAYVVHSALEQLGFPLAPRPTGGPPRVCPTLGLLGPQLHLRDWSSGTGTGVQKAGKGLGRHTPLQLNLLFPQEQLAEEDKSPTACPQPTDCLALGTGKSIFLSGL